MLKPQKKNKTLNCQKLFFVIEKGLLTLDEQKFLYTFANQYLNALKALFYIH